MYDEFPDDAPQGKARQYVEFYEKPKRDEKATKLEGRPIFKQAEYIRILVPGSRDIVDRPVRPADMEAHRTQYLRFKEGKSQAESMGTPLAMSGVVSPERVEELAAMRVRTVEQLADVSDGAAQGMGHGTIKERQRAQDYLAAIKGNAPVAQLRSENEKQAQQIAALQQQMQALIESRGSESKKQTK